MSDATAREALTRASEALHKIAAGLDARKVRGKRWTDLTEPMQKKVTETELTDEQVREVALSGFEDAVLALNQLGDPDVMVLECSPSPEVTPPSVPAIRNPGGGIATHPAYCACNGCDEVRGGPVVAPDASAIRSSDALSGAICCSELQVASTTWFCCRLGRDHGGLHRGENEGGDLVTWTTAQEYRDPGRPCPNEARSEEVVICGHERLMKQAKHVVRVWEDDPTSLETENAIRELGLRADSAVDAAQRVDKAIAPTITVDGVAYCIGDVRIMRDAARAAEHRPDYPHAARIAELEKALRDCITPCQWCEAPATWSAEDRIGHAYAPTFCDACKKAKKNEKQTYARVAGEPVWENWQRLDENIELTKILSGTRSDSPKAVGTPTK